MPEHRNCVSCGKRVYHVASSSPTGTTCRDCRVVLCLTCGKTYRDRRWSAFCSTGCNRRYWDAFYEGQAS